MINDRTARVDGLDVFYREPGDPASPKLLLGGFPASSHQFRNLIPALADRFHVLSPDYPGFGNTDMPDNWNMDLHLLERRGARRFRMDLFHDDRTNVELYPQWQAFLRERRPETLILRGENDIIFTPEGGRAYLRDLPEAELHMLDTGHFAVEDSLDEIAGHIERFYDERVAGRARAIAAEPARSTR
jgi:pimeloyl-ACP methyl ester carboxylesterase